MARARGSGTVYYRSRTGNWSGQVSRMVNGQRIRRTIYGATREAVEAKMAAIVGEAVPTPRPRTTLAAARERGTHTNAQWIAKRDAVGVCIYCGSPGPLVKDHATPLCRGGSDGIANVVPACDPCNAAKGTATCWEYLRYMLSTTGAQ